MSSWEREEWDRNGLMPILLYEKILKWYQSMLLIEEQQIDFKFFAVWGVYWGLLFWLIFKLLSYEVYEWTAKNNLMNLSKAIIKF